MIKTTVSTVTPVYSGEAYLRRLINELSGVRIKWQEQDSPLELTEAILVDDSAIDGSPAVLKELESEFNWVKVITLSRNNGQHAATVAGICHTSSDWVVTLDEDMQHPPGNIELLFAEQANQGADVVYAQPRESVHGNSWRDKSSRAVKTFLAKMSSIPQINAFNSFRLIRGSIARAAASSSSSQTYLDIAITWFTQRYSTIAISMYDERFAESKTSGYNLFKLVGHARRLLISAHVDFASAGLILGSLTMLFAFLFGCGVVIQKLFFPHLVAAAGWASSIALNTFISGIIILLLCLVLEYINVLVINQLGKPTFFTVDRSRDQELVNWFNDRPEEHMSVEQNSMGKAFEPESRI